jgi:hypothetical protein
LLLDFGLRRIFSGGFLGLRLFIGLCHGFIGAVGIPCDRVLVRDDGLLSDCLGLLKLSGSLRFGLGGSLRFGLGGSLRFGLGGSLRFGLGGSLRFGLGGSLRSAAACASASASATARAASSRRAAAAAWASAARRRCAGFSSLMRAARPCRPRR